MERGFEKKSSQRKRRGSRNWGMRKEKDERRGHEEGICRGGRWGEKKNNSVILLCPCYMLHVLNVIIKVNYE